MNEHIPVLVKEVIELLEPKPNDIFLDATLGHGGHTKAFLDAVRGEATVIGIDADANALAEAKSVLASYGDRVTYHHGNFYDLPGAKAHKILFDLGIGSHQIADESRGFSFDSSSALSMKYGEHEALPDSMLASVNDLTRRLQRYPDAQDLLNFLSPLAITEMVRVYGEERYAGVVGNAIAQGRPFDTAKQLAAHLKESLPAFYEKGRIHPATRTFQALRLAVNRELEVLRATLPKAIEHLIPGGRIAVISFHSLEDRIVKQVFKREAQGCICPPEQVVCVCSHTPRLKILTKRPVTASEEELKTNPRARSAKLRVAEKLPDQ